MLTDEEKKALMNFKKDLKDSKNKDIVALAAYGISILAMKTRNEFSYLFEDAIPVLIALLDDESDKIRFNTILALGWIDKLIEIPVELIIKSLKDENGEVRAHAAAALGRIAGWDKSNRVSVAIEELKKTFKDTDASVRAYSTFALGAIGGEPDYFVPLLLDALKDTEMEVCKYAASALGEIGSAAKPAIPALLEALEHEELEVRYKAAKALGEISEESDKVIPALIKALKDFHVMDPQLASEMQNITKSLLADVGADEVSPGLSEQLASQVSYEKVVGKQLANSDAIKALTKFGKEAIPYLKDNLDNEDEWVQKGCIEVLKNLGVEEEKAEVLPVKEKEEIQEPVLPQVSSLTQEKKDEILDLLNKQKKAKISWLATITQTSEDELHLLAKEEGLQIEGDSLFLPTETKGGKIEEEIKNNRKKLIENIIKRRHIITKKQVTIALLNGEIIQTTEQEANKILDDMKKELQLKSNDSLRSFVTIKIFYNLMEFPRIRSMHSVTAIRDAKFFIENENKYDVEISYKKAVDNIIKKRRKGLNFDFTVKTPNGSTQTVSKIPEQDFLMLLIEIFSVESREYFWNSKERMHIILVEIDPDLALRDQMLDGMTQAFINQAHKNKKK